MLKKHTYRENIKTIQIEKRQISLEGGTIRLTADFSIETMEAKSQNKWHSHTTQKIILYWAKIAFKRDIFRWIKIK